MGKTYYVGCCFRPKFYSLSIILKIGIPNCLDHKDHYRPQSIFIHNIFVINLKFFCSLLDKDNTKSTSEAKRAKGVDRTPPPNFQQSNSLFQILNILEFLGFHCDLGIFCPTTFLACQSEEEPPLSFRN